MNTYFFRMQILKEDGTPDKSTPITKPIRIPGTVDELQNKYGSPNEMIGMQVEISFRGPSVNRGYARVLGRTGATMATEVHDTEQADKLNRKGTSFAPPGGGLV